MAFFLENLVCYLSRIDLISLAEVTARGGGRTIGKINSQNFLLPLFELSETKRQSITSTLWQFPPSYTPISYFYIFIFIFFLSSIFIIHIFHPSNHLYLSFKPLLFLPKLVLLLLIPPIPILLLPLPNTTTTTTTTTSF